MSTPPKRLTAASTILSQFAAELGRRFTVSALAPSPSHSAATFLSASAPPAASTRLQPAPASTLAASAPNAPVAPVTIAVLPRTSNSESGFFKKSSDMAFSWNRSEPFQVMPAPDAGIHVLFSCNKDVDGRDRPGHGATASLHWCDRNRDGADLVAAVDDLARLVRTDHAGIVLLQHGLLAAHDHGEFSRQHDVDLLGRRGVGTGAAAGQEVRDA